MDMADHMISWREVMVEKRVANPEGVYLNHSRSGCCRQEAGIFLYPVEEGIFLCLPIHNLAGTHLKSTPCAG